MDHTRLTAGKGLYFLFVGQIIALFIFVPLFGGIAAIAEALTSLYGFYILSQATSDYKNAFILTLASVVLSFLRNFLSGGILVSSLAVISNICGFAVVYFVCISTAKLLSGINQTQVNRAGLIWKLYALCTLILIACSLASYIPIISILAGAVSFVTTIVQLLASILYLVFLWNCQKLLRG